MVSLAIEGLTFESIINSNSKNIGYRVNKGEVLGLKKN